MSEKVVVRFRGEIEFSSKHGKDKAQKDLNKMLRRWIDKHSKGGLTGVPKVYVFNKEELLYD